jgi:hypothetical protein
MDSEYGPANFIICITFLRDATLELQTYMHNALNPEIASSAAYQLHVFIFAGMYSALPYDRIWNLMDSDSDLTGGFLSRHLYSVHVSVSFRSIKTTRTSLPCD